MMHRIEMCRRCAVTEGAETGDAITHLTKAATILYNVADEHHSQLALLTAENLCQEHIKWLLHTNEEFDIYNEIELDVYTYFTGRNQKLTEDQWDKRIR